MQSMNKNEELQLMVRFVETFRWITTISSSSSISMRRLGKSAIVHRQNRGCASTESLFSATNPRSIDSILLLLLLVVSYTR